MNKEEKLSAMNHVLGTMSKSSEKSDMDIESAEGWLSDNKFIKSDVTGNWSREGFVMLYERDIRALVSVPMRVSVSLRGRLWTVQVSGEDLGWSDSEEGLNLYGVMADAIASFMSRGYLYMSSEPEEEEE